MSEARPSSLVLRNISKHYPVGKVPKAVLDSVDFDIKRGDFVALAGSNGAGKSTLMRIAGGLEHADGGQVSVFGRSMDEHLESPQHRIGLISENLRFSFPVSMNEMAKVVAECVGQWNDALFREVSDQFQLDTKKKWSEVSRGQKVQFAFLTQICAPPDLLILDEVTAVLDPSVRAICVGQMRRLANEGCTVMLATNILTEAQQQVDRVLILQNGKIAVDQSRTQVGVGFVKLLASDTRQANELHALGAQPVQHNSDGSVTFVAKQSDLNGNMRGQSQLEIGSDKRHLTAEDVFIYHTRKGA